MEAKHNIRHNPEPLVQLLYRPRNLAELVSRTSGLGQVQALRGDVSSLNSRGLASLYVLLFSPI